MADKKSTPKFNLVKKTVTASEASPEPLDTEEQPASPSKLTLKDSGPEKPSAPQASKEIEVTKLLDDAYAPEEKRRQKSILATRIRKLSLILAASALSIFLMYAYAHIWQKWPLLDEVTWYIPFVASIFIALFACAKAFSILSKERSYIMAATGLCIAGALTYWNAIVLEVAAQPEHYAPDNLFWESEDELERLLAYEINACRGWSLSPAPYVQISEDTYKKAFRFGPHSAGTPKKRHCCRNY